MDSIKYSYIMLKMRGSNLRLWVNKALFSSTLNTVHPKLTLFEKNVQSSNL